MRLESSRWLKAHSMLGFCLPKQGVTSALCYLFTLLMASDVFLSHAGGTQELVQVYSDAHALRVRSGHLQSCFFVGCLFGCKCVCVCFGVGRGFESRVLMHKSMSPNIFYHLVSPNFCFWSPFFIKVMVCGSLRDSVMHRQPVSNRWKTDFLNVNMLSLSNRILMRHHFLHHWWLFISILTPAAPGCLFWTPSLCLLLKLGRQICHCPSLLSTPHYRHQDFRKEASETGRVWEKQEMLITFEWSGYVFPFNSGLPFFFFSPAHSPSFHRLVLCLLWSVRLPGNVQQTYVEC